MGKIYVVGLGPGAGAQMTAQARQALSRCSVIVGYPVYLDLIQEEFAGKRFLSTPMRKEEERCRMAFAEAEGGSDVAMVCSGDAGVYGMAGLLYEIGEKYPEIELIIVPGITAAIGGAAVLGAPLMHDFAVISLSDLLTPWEKIAQRLKAAAMADFVICLYNPSSKKRKDYLKKACDIMMEYKSSETVCGLVKNIGRDGETSRVLTLGELRETQVDMFTTVYIGNEQTRRIGAHMVTPRGYRLGQTKTDDEQESEKMEQQIYLIGIGMGNAALLTREERKIVAGCDRVIGAERMLEALAEYQKPTFQCYQAEEIRAWIVSHPQDERIVIALSGDPGFYSGAKKLLGELKDYPVTVCAGISSVSYLAAKLKVSWEDAALVSIHGRRQNYIQTIAFTAKTFLLLGGINCGQEICEKISYYGLQDVKFYIGKQLSYPQETVIEKCGSDLKPEDFDGLCTVLAVNQKPKRWIGRRIADEEWIRAQVPMTKEEVRTISIRKLDLTEDAVLYDIGAGTGSVAIEAALQSAKIRVYAMEKNPQAVELIRKNKQKFCADWVEVCEGAAPEVLAGLEAPTHVFVGGSGGRLKEILACVREKNPKAHVVINAVSLETLREVMEAAQEGLLLNPEIVQLSVAKARELGTYHMMTGQNPVYIISDGKTV